MSVSRSFLMLLAVATLMPLVGCGLLFEKQHPKDAELIENFRRHRQEFEALIEVFRSDTGVGRVGATFTRSSDFFGKCADSQTRDASKGTGSSDTWDGQPIHVSKERFLDYQRRFKDLGLTAGIEGYCAKDLIGMYASTQGLSVTGSSKGYAFMTKPPQILVDDLDSFWSEDGRSFTAYRRIDGNWYLFFDYED